MSETFQTLLPIVTLLIGAWLTGRTKKADVRSNMRLEAADLLADVPALLWQKGTDGDWTRLTTGLDRLRFRLCLAGLPPKVAQRLVDGGQEFWTHVEWQEGIGPEGEDGWTVTTTYTEAWQKASEIVVQWLADNWRLRRWARVRLNARRLGPAKRREVLHLGEL